MSDEPVKGELVPYEPHEIVDAVSRELDIPKRYLASGPTSGEALERRRRRELRPEQALRILADNVRLVLMDKAQLSQGAIHDGNHGPECDACNLFRFAERYCTQPWFKVVRAAAEAQRLRFDE